MSHPHDRQVKRSMSAKHHSLGVKGEHPEHKAHRMCGGGVSDRKNVYSTYSHGGAVHEVKEAPKGKMPHQMRIGKPTGG